MAQEQGLVTGVVMALDMEQCVVPGAIGDREDLPTIFRRVSSPLIPTNRGALGIN